MTEGEKRVRMAGRTPDDGFRIRHRGPKAHPFAPPSVLRPGRACAPFARRAFALAKFGGASRPASSTAPPMRSPIAMGVMKKLRSAMQTDGSVHTPASVAWCCSLAPCRAARHARAFGKSTSTMRPAATTTRSKASSLPSSRSKRTGSESENKAPSNASATDLAAELWK